MAPPYDPDAHPNDLDPADPEAVDRFLRDPANNEMWELIGKHFRDSPPADQVEELSEVLVQHMRRRDYLAALLEGAPVDDARWALHGKFVEMVRTVVARIAELSEQAGPPMSRFV